MLSMTDGGSLRRALSSTLDNRIKRLLRLRRYQLSNDMSDQAHFVIVQHGDTPAALEQALGFSVFQNLGDGTYFDEPDWSPGWEWMDQHDFGWELCFILTDDGFAHVVIVPRSDGIDPSLIELCTTHASEHA
jgi:hypothetical protein